jgi:hypothetical protein
MNMYLVSPFFCNKNQDRIEISLKDILIAEHNLADVRSYIVHKGHGKD